MSDRPAQSRPWRLFIAAPLPAATAARLWHSLAGLRAGHPRARWLPAEQMHVTLVFLGATDPARVPELEGALRSAAAAFPAFTVGTAAAGGRVDARRAGVAWLRLGEGGRQLARLSLDLDQLIGSAAYAKDGPHPHLTLVRRVDPPLLADLRAAAPRLRIDWRLDRVVLYRSHTGPAGARYEILAEQPLTQAAASP